MLRFLLPALLLVACASPSAQPKKIVCAPLPPFHFVPPVLMDSGVFRSFTFKDVLWRDMVSRKLLYIGPNVDSLFICRASCELRPGDTVQRFPVGRLNQFRIVVDTTKIIGTNYWDVRLNQHECIYKTTRAYAAYIINATHDTLMLDGRGGSPVLMEAETRLHDWAPIEEPLLGCGTGARFQHLAPGEIALITASIYRGPTPARLRLRMGEIVSNSFSGSIHRTQFESEFDDNGNYKPLPIDR